MKGLRAKLETMTRGQLRLNIIEIEQPEMDPYLVGKSIADQLSRRVAYRRAMRQAALRTMQAGAEGVKSSPRAASPGRKSPARRS